MGHRRPSQGRHISGSRRNLTVRTTMLTKTCAVQANRACLSVANQNIVERHTSNINSKYQMDQTHRAYNLTGNGVSVPVSKRLRCEAGHSLLPCAEVKNAWSYTSNLQVSIFMAQYLLEHRHNFTFTSPQKFIFQSSHTKTHSHRYVLADS